MTELTIDQALQKGIEAHKAGQIQEADRLYTAILKAQPKHPDANHNMGVLAVGVGKVEQALPFFKTALEANPNTAQLWLSYIDALIKLDQLADAKAVLDQAKGKGAKGDGFDKLEKRLNKTLTVQDPSQAQLQSLINLYDQGQLQKAHGQAKALVQHFPRSAILLNIQGAVLQGLGQIGLSIEAYKKSLSIKPDYVEAYNNIGNAFRGQGKLEEAIDAYNQALAIKPDCAEAYSNMGNALKDQGKLEAAIEAYNKALAVKPDYAEAYNNMSVTLQEQGKLEEAIKAYNKVLAIKPSYAEAHNNMGVALKDQGKLEAAIEAYSKALAIKPDYTEAYNNIGNALQEQGKLEEAIDAYNKALAIKPDYADAYYNTGNALLEQGNLEEAIKAYNKVLAIKPDYAKACYNSGNALTAQGKLEEAIDAYNKALAIKPDFAEAYVNTGNVLKEQGKVKEAVEAYNKALAIKPDHAAAKVNKAKMLFEGKNYEEAAKLFKKNYSSESQLYFLRCLYNQDERVKFYDQLDHLINQGEDNAVIGSYISRSQIRYGINRANPFCNDPLNYVLHTNLINRCDFENTFVKGATDILTKDIVQNRSQRLLTNGIQTTGNVFNQIGNITDEIQSILHSEIENYRMCFKDSQEGLIKSWPSSYEINGWLVSMKSGGKLAAHMHDKGWISGSVYINVPPKVNKDSGNFVVCLDSEKLSQSIDVVTGSLCLFPSSLLHYTIPFESEENRIVLAFDVIPK